MQLNKLSIKDKNIFVKYLSVNKHNLSVYAFENIFIWSGLFDIRWDIIDDALCIFFKDKIGAFLYLPPLTKKTVSPVLLGEIFKILDGFNVNTEVSRIENIEEDSISTYLEAGLRVDFKSCDYLCRSKSIAVLSGNAYKHKRSSYNSFIKSYDYEWLEYSDDFLEECLSLYKLWSSQRKAKYADKVYSGMMDDSFNALSVLLKHYRKLACQGRVVRIKDRVKAFTFGFKLNNDTFCVLYEITDLTIKGLAQFIFSRFVSEAKDCTYVNIMDDSGLDNLKSVKLSYRPVKLVKSFIARK